MIENRILEQPIIYGNPRRFWPQWRDISESPRWFPYLKPVVFRNDLVIFETLIEAQNFLDEQGKKVHPYPTKS